MSNTPPRHPMGKKGKKPKVKQEEPPLLSASGSGYVKDPKYALGISRQHATPPEHLLGGEADENAEPPEPAAVYPEDQKWITQDAKNRFDLIKAEEMHKREAVSMAAQVRELYALARQQGQDVPEIRKAIDDAKKRLKRAA